MTISPKTQASFHQCQQVLMNGLPRLVKVDGAGADFVAFIGEVSRQRRVHRRIEQHHLAGVGYPPRSPQIVNRSGRPGSGS
jgi:hypothetical protein